LNNNMYKRLISFFLYWISNSFIFLVADISFPEFLELGNVLLTPSYAALTAGFILAIVIALVEPIFSTLNIHVKHQGSWALIYWIINSETIWGTARFAEYIGLGISAYWVAAVVAAAANILQWGSWNLVNRTKI